MLDRMDLLGSPFSYFFSDLFTFPSSAGFESGGGGGCRLRRVVVIFIVLLVLGVLFFVAVVLAALAKTRLEKETFFSCAQSPQAKENRQKDHLLTALMLVTSDNYSVGVAQPSRLFGTDHVSCLPEALNEDPQKRSCFICVCK